MPGFMCTGPDRCQGLIAWAVIAIVAGLPIAAFIAVGLGRLVQIVAHRRDHHLGLLMASLIAAAVMVGLGAAFASIERDIVRSVLGILWYALVLAGAVTAVRLAWHRLRHSGTTS